MLNNLIGDNRGKRSKYLLKCVHCGRILGDANRDIMSDMEVMINCKTCKKSVPITTVNEK